jgi:hypothetical protein
MNPSTETAFEALNIDFQNRDRRLPEAPARDYSPAPTEEQQVDPLEFDGVPKALIPVDAAPLSSKVKATIAKMPEIAELQKIASEDNKARELQKQFTTDAARAAFKTSMAAAIECGDGDKIRALPSEAEQIASYADAHRQLDEKLKKIARQALPYIEAVVLKSIKLIIQDRTDAEAALAEVFTKRELPTPSAHIISDPYSRAAQNLQRDLEFQRGGNIYRPLKNFLASVGVC